MKCADCHRNDLSHQIIRGYEGESEDYGNPKASDFSCGGCHTGKDPLDGEKTEAGRRGAPYPQHKGIPTVHFEKLSCTVCHSGPLLKDKLERVRTSRANRLGIYGAAQWFTDFPSILEPVYTKDINGKITPHRLIWPAFWGKLVGETLTPLEPEAITSVAQGILDAETEVARVLMAFSTNPELTGIPVLVTEGKYYEVNADGGLDVLPYAGDFDVTGILWAAKNNGEILPLVSDFDPDAEEVDVDIETNIQFTLEALATFEKTPGLPVLIHKKALYQLVEGYLEKMENPGEAVTAPQWYWLDGDQLQPLCSDFQIRTVLETVGFEQILTEEQVGLTLERLASADIAGENESISFFYISGGKMFKLDEEGKLAVIDHPAAEPVTWPLGHQVRPAQQSLGIKGCKDCHSAGSHFFFNKVEGNGPLKTQQTAKRSMSKFMGEDKPYHKLFGLSFSVRPVFKAVIFISALIVGAILLLIGMLALGKASGLIEKRR
jgi:hypothetical protein